MNPFKPREILDVAIFAESDKPDLGHPNALLLFYLAFWTIYMTAVGQRLLLKLVAESTNVPSWKPQGRDGEVDILDADALMLGRIAKIRG